MTNIFPHHTRYAIRGTVFVGLSGGVDSAVAAALLKREGYDVTGVFIKIWQPEFIECSWREDRLDAMRVAASLGIPFREVDLSDEYKREVVDSMIAGYLSGITPNPDVLCNRIIKFGHFFRWARAEGADMIATGHHARIRQKTEGKRQKSGIGDFELFRGRDSGKDQSYFLAEVEHGALARTLFPVGGCTKSAVRAFAKKFGFSNADKPDSQGLCFVGDVVLSDFLVRYITLGEGPVLLGEKPIGRHGGAALYTIGQRHGFTATSDVPLYVVGIDTEKNVIRVSPKKEDAARSEARIEKVHWIENVPAPPSVFDVQTRYREKPVRARIEAAGGGVRASFEAPHIFSPGQMLVVYEGERCLGGGTIVPSTRV